MLGLGTGKGGRSSNQQVQGQPQGGGMPGMAGSGLAALFANNGPASGGGNMPAPMPQIMAPQRPQIQMPVGRPMPQMQQPAQDPAQSLREKMLRGWANYNQSSPVERMRIRRGER